MTLIAHISDLHVSKANFNEKSFLQIMEEINNLNPDMIILTGDLTDEGYYQDFKQVSKYLDMFNAPLFAVPGNHDSRNIGYETFEELIGERSWKLTKEDEMVIIGLDSSAPDVNYGHIGREQQFWLESQLEQAKEEGLLTIVALHHHVIPIPQTGRERNVLTDAGDILKTLIDHDVDIVMCGHKHVPNLWKMHDTLFVNAGSVSSVKLRGKDVNSYNTYNITDDYIEIFLNRIDGTKIPFGKFNRKL
ncbi:MULTISPECIES: metallophosphoesterase family protein [unclassified Methanobrevibacter]|uniref:metallophosphoesterase family protein n=4 Tax=Methanobrevibacter TaxID=2172 RepID=UPI0039B848D7